MRIHLIAVGGSIMHNLAIELQRKGHIITGSDDEIYDPSRSRLEKYGLLPTRVGWYPEENITKDLDCVILGMHARPDNMELRKAKELGVKIYSFPEFVYQQSKKKKRVVVGGSHGKTTTTSMIMHVLMHNDVEYDYLVGAQLEGFELMVRLSDAPIIILEGDEYLSSPIDKRPKFLHYKPHIAIITGIAWDHINVFPTFSGYVNEFRNFIQGMRDGTKLFYYGWDEHLQKLILENEHYCEAKLYTQPSYRIENSRAVLQTDTGDVPLKIFGKHNLENLQAAWYVCKELGLSDQQFLEAIATFKGAARRLQHLGGNKITDAYLDFAHAPSKAKATVNAVKSLNPERKLIACLELHTFSSLNKDFHPEYKSTLAEADEAFVFYSEHTLEMKKLPYFKPEELAAHFNHPNLQVITDSDELYRKLSIKYYGNTNLLLMSSGRFGGMDMETLLEKVLL
ncbi:MAG: UDP-N-acetylmuramate: L-alanyl-gamma-D-glutamyl-meso-diaminopimelate ligase [Maribacter sp.]|jgi:UDP-N-acetylmuramate: L-alanyl-gamma-D-glutamyl-meso-diaminopimelate ligase